MEKTLVIEVDKGPLIFGATYSGIDPFGPIGETEHPSTYQLVGPVEITAPGDEREFEILEIKGE